MRNDKPAVLTFRVESTCTFAGNHYKATDEEGGGLVQFPAELIYDVPQHFSAVRGGWTQPDPEGNRKLVDTGEDEETNALRDAYFAIILVVFLTLLCGKLAGIGGMMFGAILSIIVSIFGGFLTGSLATLSLVSILVGSLAVIYAGRKTGGGGV